jgi:hypothetical protein
MRLEILLQFIVPLTFLAIWALTSLLNRDAQPLPPRPSRSPVPGGPRAGVGPSPISRGDLAGPARNQGTGRLPTAGEERPSAARWAGSPAQGRAGGPDEGIVILESNARGSSQPSLSQFSPSSAASSRGARVTTARRASTRGRSVSAAAPLKPIEPEHPRALTGLVSQSLAQKKARPLEITPLSTPMTPISSSPLTQKTVGAAIEHPGSYQLHTALTSGELRTMLASPTKLREVALLTELLQQPLALRPPRRLR